MSDDQTKLCPGCGRAVRADAHYCGSCGTAVHPQAPGTPAPQAPGTPAPQAPGSAPAVSPAQRFASGHTATPALAWVAVRPDTPVSSGDSLPGVGVYPDGRPVALGEGEHGRYQVEIETLRAVGPGGEFQAIEAGAGTAVISTGALVVSCVRGRSVGGDVDFTRDGGALVVRWAHRDIERISARHDSDLVVVSGAGGAMLGLRVLGPDLAAENPAVSSSLFDALATQAASAQMTDAAGPHRARLLSIVTGGEREQDAFGGLAVRFHGVDVPTAIPAGAVPPGVIPAAVPELAGGQALEPAATGASVPSGASGPKPLPRAMVIGLAAVAVVVIAAGSAGAFMLFGGGGNDERPRGDANTSAAEAGVVAAGDPAAQASPAALEEPEDVILVPKSVKLTSAFIDNDPDYDPANLCFGPGRTSRGIPHLVLGGVRYEQDFVQCGTRSGGQTANGYYRFARRDVGVVPGSVINGISGDFVIDETSGDRSAVIRWTVRYGDRVVCRATARWGAPGNCTSTGGGVAVERAAPLTIEQKVTSSSSGSIWAGIHHPVLEVDIPG